MSSEIKKLIVNLTFDIFFPSSYLTGFNLVLRVKIIFNLYIILKVMDHEKSEIREMK